MSADSWRRSKAMRSEAREAYASALRAVEAAWEHREGARYHLTAANPFRLNAPDPALSTGRRFVCDGDHARH